MGMYIAILPDADRGMPRWGVTPSHGLDGRIGIAAPAAVVQPQARHRHAQPEARTRERNFRAQAPRSKMCTRGSASVPRVRRSKTDLPSIGRVEPGALIVVAHTERRGRIRLISARPASRKERRVYHERTLR